jgi:hypothetical protein
MKCDLCDGRGVRLGHYVGGTVTCWECGGSGSFTEKQAAAIAQAQADDLGASLRTARRADGLTMGDVGRYFGESVSDVSAWENNRKPVPDFVRKHFALKAGDA